MDAPRLMTGGFSILLMLIEDLEHGFGYAYLMNNIIDKDNLIGMKCMKIILLIALVTIIFIQLRIVIFKKTVARKSETNQMKATEFKGCYKKSKRQ